MAVYADPLMDWGWRMYGKKVKSCHLTADSEQELLEFGRKLGFKDSWLMRPKQPWKPMHYDLVGSKRIKAIELGAKPITFIEVKDLIKKRKKELRSKQDVTA